MKPPEWMQGPSPTGRKHDSGPPGNLSPQEQKDQVPATGIERIQLPDG